VNDVSATGVRAYLGGSVEFTALVTVLREIPKRSAIRVFGTPSRSSLRISAQSSKVITLQVSSAHFPLGRTAQNSAGADTISVPYLDDPSVVDPPKRYCLTRRRSGASERIGCDDLQADDLKV
jgi:hypothetical protein